MIVLGWVFGGLACDSTPVGPGEDPNFVGGGRLTLTVGEEMQSYVEADWTSPASGPTRLEWADADGTVLVTDWQPGADAAEVPVLGLWVGDTFTASLVDEAGLVYARETITTGSGPVALAGVHASGTASWTGYLFTSLIAASTPVAVVLTPAGRVVWYHEVGSTPLTRVLPRADGAGLWTLSVARTQPVERAALRSYGWDGAALADVSPYGHGGEGASHDFIVTEEDTLRFLAFDSREVDGVLYRGDAVFEMGVDGADETSRWSAWDRFTPGADVPDPSDWTHANALRVSPSTGTVFVGLRALSTLVELDPREWTELHQIGGEGADVTFTDGTAAFSAQHGFDLRGDSLVMHDNRTSAEGTRIVAFDLDRAAGTLHETWEYVPEPALYDYVLGDATWIDDDTVLANWSTSGLLEEVNPEGVSTWSLTLDLGLVFGYSARFDHLPGSAPVTGGSTAE